MKLFSLLIANYNNGHFFKDCYESILNQSYQNWEVIIVDDFSTDDSISVIKELIDGDSRFKLFRNSKNFGCGYTKNRCADLANGEILGFLDPDDALKKNALEVMMNAHIKRQEMAIISSKYEFVDLDLNFLDYGKQGESIPSGKSYLTAIPGIITAFATFKKSKYDLTIGIDVKMKRAVDQDLYFKLEEYGNHFFLDAHLYLYRIHDNSISANENKYKAQYWHFYAMVQAYKRRKRLKLKINNFTPIEYKKLKANYYLSRFERAKSLNQFYKKRFFLIMSIVSFPTYKLRFIIKSIFK
ncbi:glycosyltransferase family 2 protein [Flavobacterium branchiicola]|uniref:Glycosyltransferase family 2 protein n=1 Tax=Flavobacterium branchiicola TaxID=1114875 RepID=A0ABV9PFW0_9FLAO|nr:glycosyltransferase family 2 protein [Flavobacterium branchiicola]MBS7255476.1 glycosyltransferase family 2 protein [Flavobacterium branchiicola]